MDDKYEGLLVIAAIVIGEICIISLLKLFFGKPKKTERNPSKK